MPEVEDRQAAGDIAGRALAAMRAHGIEPTPECFTVYFRHVSGEDPALSRAMARIEASAGSPELEDVRALHRLFCNASLDPEGVQAVGERVGEVVDEVSHRLDVASSHTRDYSERLSTLGSGLSTAVNSSELFALVRELEHQTELMSRRVNSLQGELDRSSREIDVLKDDLANARRAASTDPLTGLANRKVFDENFTRAVREAEAGAGPLALLVADIDHFKSFNDTHGHQIGDLVLRLVADRLKRSVKGRDTVARYGGEEFVILLPQTSLTDAAALAEQLRDEIGRSRLVMRNRGQELGKVTLSIGIAGFRAGETTETCFRRADEALYAAKRTGRNRVVTEQQLVVDAA